MISPEPVHDMIGPVLISHRIMLFRLTQVFRLRYVSPFSYLLSTSNLIRSCYQFAPRARTKPAQIKCSEGYINLIPEWAKINGDIWLTPFHNLHDWWRKVESYVQELISHNKSPLLTLSSPLLLPLSGATLLSLYPVRSTLCQLPTSIWWGGDWGKTLLTTL